MRRLDRGLPRLEPSAALVKALLINGAVREPKGECALLYDMVQGWGHMRLENIFEPPGDMLVEWDDVPTEYGLQIGKTQERTVELGSMIAPLKVTLVWTDPASQMAQLVNDLDLEVVGQNGDMYFGNDQDPPFKQRRDRTNNVECVFIPSGLLVSSTYTIRVTFAHQAPRSSTEPPAIQSYALVWSGALKLPTDDTGG
jgi:hypothetical protein